MLEPQSRFIDLNGHRFHYLDFGGDGPPAVFLHGTGLHAWMWKPYGAALGERYRVLALDQRGHGDSVKSHISFDWNEFADDLARFIESLHLDAPLCVGHSMGGTIIVLAEGRHPGLIDRAVLIDPIIMADEYYSDSFTVETDPLAARTLKRREVWDSRDEMIEKYRRKPPFETWRPEQLETYVVHGTETLPDGRIKLKCSPEIEAQTYCGGHLVDPWPYLGAIRMPTLILRGAKDERARMTKARQVVETMPRAELIEIADATHFLPMEFPELVIEHIIAFDESAKSGRSKPGAGDSAIG